MPVTLESNRILIDTVEVETVKTHVPEVDIDIDIVPAITNNEGDPAFELLTYTHSGGSEDQTEFNLTINEDTTCDILIVGGGGGGGRWRAGGGGGDVLYFENITLNGTYNINVGKGGSVPRGTPTSAHHFGGFSGETSSITGGDSSYILNVNAGGGGGAGGWSLDALPGVTVSYTNPLTGNTETSSGGGAGTSKITQTPSSGNSVSGNGGQGDYDGWDNSSDDGAGGGGGGGGTNGHGGIPSGETGGLGGDGETIDITGNSIIYGKGGNGWGANDPLPTTTPPNIGQGGAGAEYNYGTPYHMAGGSGIVIIRKYLTPSALYETQTTVTQYPVLPADATNLVAWYKFDDDFTDSSGNGNDLDLTEDSQPITYSTGIINDAVNLDGIGTNGNGTYFKTPASFNAYNVWNGNGITLSGWFKPSSTSNSSSNIFAIYESNTYRINLVRRGTGSTFYIAEFLSTSNRNTYDAAISYPDFYDDKWHHLVLTIDKDIDENNRSITKIYLDAILIETFNSEFRNNLTKILLGAAPNSVDGDTGNRYYKELIDDFRIYDKALSAYEIDILANNKIENPDYNILTFEYQGPSYPVIDADAASLVAHYKFDDISDIGKDSSGSYHLTNTTSTLSSDAIIQESVSFDGGDYLLKSDANIDWATMTTTNGFSVAFWIKYSSWVTLSAIMEANDDDSAGNGNRMYIRRDDSNNKIRLDVRQVGTGTILAEVITNTLNSDTWYFITFTFVQNDLKVYVDGSLHNSTTTASFPISNTNYLQLGRQYTATSRDFYGKSDDFRIYDKALSAYEIDILANNKIENTDYNILTFEYKPNDLIFTFREDESPYSWQEAYDEAIANGKRMPTKTELLNYLASQGNQPLYQEDVWCAVVAPEYSNGRDYICIGNHPAHFVGKSHTELENGYPSWGDPDNTYTFKRFYCEVLDQTSYTVNFPAESECDILIVGGGGGGSESHGGGGGAGAVIFMKDVVMNGSYNIKVGKGGDVSQNLGNNGIGFNGNDSEIFKTISNKVIAEGGGGGGAINGIGGDGGSGGGGDGYFPPHSGIITPSGGNAVSYTPILDGITGIKYGNNGGSGYINAAGCGGGGGGAGAVGESATSINDNTVYGGVGVYKATISGSDYNFKDLFNLPTNNTIGEYHSGGTYAGSTYNEGVYFGGGGGGGLWENPEPNPSNVVGGLGGGGTSGGYTPTVNAENGLVNTGGGGGGGGSGGSDGGSGGSGIVIIRYKTKYIIQHPAYDAQWTYHSANPNVHHYGNVGIGTLASETNKLTVKGDINIIGDIYENNNKIAYGWDVYGNSVYNQYGNVGIGTNDPRYALHTTGIIYAGQGGITETGSTTWTITSDNRIKENIEKASYDICSENIKNINLYRFNYNTKYVKTTDKNQLGFIAQDVRKYFPKAVKNKTTRFDNDVVPNLLSVDVTQLNYTMYGAVKHIGQDIDAIKEKLGITEVPTEIKNEPYAIEVIPFNDPDAELPIVNEEPATN